MTKEKVLQIAKSDGRVYLDRLEEFFASNICTPKGTNRHPYADILHEWIEGSVDLQLKDSTIYVSSAISLLRGDFCIKQPEPIYEYLWLDLRTPDDFYCPTSKYMTEAEAKARFSSSETYFKVLETKRLRQ